IRIDMSEYMEKHSVARLIGAPPGYVGYEEGGYLTEAVRRKPYSVILLDEVEKAHPDVFNLLLQVMDHGSLTDTNGRRVDFRNVILVMTSNAGAQEISRRSMGFAKQDHSTDASEVITRMFTPEFRNRLDAIIQFNHLTEDTIQFVVEKFISKLQAQLEEKQVELVVEEPAKHWIATRGYDAQMGARPMERVIQEKIKRPLADEILFGKLAKGGEVTVSVEDDELQFLLEAHSPSATKIT
ncbi:MAG TPA: ATP-dependent Clp protease ATP-binding subunit ClpA, partial [Gammaproteobacteria bacterium]|nr:ATP-dependent Clp protease ATP-binding subunit ClpA [Gammaproteobacteria bacterium]